MLRFAESPEKGRAARGHSHRSRPSFEKAGALIEALGYIQRFNEKIVVVKLGGSFMDNDDEFRKVLTDVVFMQAVGMRPIVVHGGGKAITDAMKKAGLQAQFVQGRRYTDERTLAIAEHVLCNDINGFIVNTHQRDGGQGDAADEPDAHGAVCGEDVAGEDGAKIDIGQVGAGHVGERAAAAGAVRRRILFR